MLALRCQGLVQVRRVGVGSRTEKTGQILLIFVQANINIGFCAMKAKRFY